MDDHDDFSADVETSSEAIVIHVRGEIDLSTAGRLRDVIEPHLGPEQRIVLDLSEVRFMDSSSLHVLEHARGRLTADGGSLVLRNPSPAARRLLTVAGAQRLLDTEERDAAADRRDDLANVRDGVANARDVTADERDVIANARDVTADERDRAATGREAERARRESQPDEQPRSS
jgi:anti-anti-sigma factor